MFVLSCVCYVLCASVYMCFVVTCWERADLLALVCGVFCEFVTFPLVSWVRCGTWLYRFLIFAPLLTYITKLTSLQEYQYSTDLARPLSLSLSLSLHHRRPHSHMPCRYHSFYSIFLRFNMLPYTHNAPITPIQHIPRIPRIIKNR